MRSVFEQTHCWEIAVLLIDPLRDLRHLLTAVRYRIAFGLCRRRFLSARRTLRCGLDSTNVLSRDHVLPAFPLRLLRFLSRFFVRPLRRVGVAPVRDQTLVVRPLVRQFVLPVVDLQGVDVAARLTPAHYVASRTLVRSTGLLWVAL